MTPARSSAAKFEWIGRIHTPFKAEDDLPIQGTANKARGTAAILPKYMDGLADLGGFDRIWLIYEASEKALQSLRIVPKLDGAPHGVFATRSLIRPNPIGLTCVKLLRMDGGTLHVEGVDMLDGCGLLDIKPYVPRFDSYPDAWSGWLENRIPHEDAWKEQKGRPHSERGKEQSD